MRASTIVLVSIDPISPFVLSTLGSMFAYHRIPILLATNSSLAATNASRGTPLVIILENPRLVFPINIFSCPILVVLKANPNWSTCSTSIAPLGACPFYFYISILLIPGVLVPGRGSILGMGTLSINSVVASSGTF